MNWLKVQPEGPSRPGTAVLSERLHARTATKPKHVHGMLTYWCAATQRHHLEDDAKYTALAGCAVRRSMSQRHDRACQKCHVHTNAGMSCLAHL